MSIPTSPETEKMASLGRMTRGLVHDINNSLASIMGYAEFLVSDLPEGSEQALFAENIKKAGLQLQGTLDQVRAVSMERNTGKDTPLNIVELVETIVNQHRATLENGQTIDYTHSVDEAVLSYPDHQIRTLFMNLIRNATESLEQKSGHITIHIDNSTAKRTIPLYDFHKHVLEHKENMPPHVKITLTDTGCGMDNETINLAIEPHFTTKTANEAKGMGLPIAVGILNYLEAELTIASTPQRGTQVTIFLPVESISQRKEKETIAQEPKSILLVEDRDMVRHTIETMLAREGHKVTSVADGHNALDILRETPRGYDLMITDFSMPEINGKDIIEEVHADFPRLPIIIISGDNDHLKSIENNDLYKSVTTLAKPISSENLNKALQSALK